MEKLFKLKAHKTNVRTEILAGLTTFMTMAYVLAVQPSAIIGGEATFVDIAGVTISREGLMLTCALVTSIITMVMAFYTNMPFALSTGMGSNFLLGFAIQGGQLSFGGAMAIILISGIIFLVLSLLGIRDVIVKMIPKNIKIAISATIGFFIAYLGFKNTGIADFSNGIAMGDFTSPAVLLSVATLILIAILHANKVPGAILIGMVASTVASIIMGLTDLPSRFVSLPNFSAMKPLFFNFNFKELVSGSAIVFIFVCFFSDFFSTLGTVLGVAGKAGMLDENGDLPNIQKPFLVDAIGTVVGAFTGNTTVTTYVESSAGVEAGGRTGLTSFTTAVMFFISLFFAPLFLIVPAAATGPALIFVGISMISGLQNIDFSEFDDAFGPVIMLLFGIFHASIASGISAGILAHVFIKVFTGKAKEVPIGLYILCVPLIIYFIFA
jgi:AGZA family xanthine/uracil permease-like MFS transporter